LSEKNFSVVTTRKFWIFALPNNIIFHPKKMSFIPQKNLPSHKTKKNIIFHHERRAALLSCFHPTKRLKIYHLPSRNKKKKEKKNVVLNIIS